jgi:hypothetical protein
MRHLLRIAACWLAFTSPAWSAGTLPFALLRQASAEHF